MSAPGERGGPRGAVWIAGVTAAVGLAFAAAYAPGTSAFVVLAVASASALVWRLGFRLGMWCLFLATIPIREPLSVDLVGTTTLYLNDVLLLGLTLTCFLENGLRGILRGSATFRIGLGLAALALGGLYTATRLKWGINFVLLELSQVAAFYVAWHRVRDGRSARYTLAAFVFGMLPAVAVGLYQTTLPLSYFRQLVGSIPAIAWDEAGNPNVRIFSTFNHPLLFSHALSMAVGLGAGLLSGASPGAGLLLAAAVGSIAYCNQYTYSIGGLLGTAAAFLAAVFASRHRWLLFLLPVGFVAAAAVAPRVFLLRAESSFSGTNPTVAARLVTYYQSFQVIRDHPLLGVGWGSMRTALEHDYRVTRSKLVAFTSENYFLERAVATGLVGLGLTLALCVLFFRNARSRAPGDPLPWPRVALLAGGVAFYVQAQFIPAADPASRYVLWTLFAVAERMRIAATRSHAPTGRAIGEEGG